MLLESSHDLIGAAHNPPTRLDASSFLDSLLPRRDAFTPHGRPRGREAARVRNGTFDETEPTAIGQVAELVTGHELDSEVAFADGHYEADLRVRQDLSAEPQERRPHLRVITMHQIVSELERVQDRFRHEDTRLGLRHMLEKRPSTFLHRTKQLRRLHADRRCYCQVQALGTLRPVWVAFGRQHLTVIVDAPRLAEDPRDGVPARLQPSGDRNANARRRRTKHRASRDIVSWLCDSSQSHCPLCNRDLRTRRRPLQRARAH